MNPSEATLGQYLEQRETELQRRIDEIHRGLVPLEAELADVRKAKAAIAERTETPPPRPGLNALLARRRAAVFHGGGLAIDTVPGPHEESAPTAKDSPSPYVGLTQQQLVLRALSEHFPNGATVNQLVEFFHNAWKRTDVIRSSLSPQLSRLKVSGQIELIDNKIWKLVTRDKAPPEGGASRSSSTEGWLR